MEVTWENKWQWNTGYTADSVEWCPLESYLNVFVCGTYQLVVDSPGRDPPGIEPKKQTRLGRIYLFVLEQITQDLKPVQTIDVFGILDQKWCYHLLQEYPVLGTVNSEGKVYVYRLIKKGEGLKLEEWISDSIGENVLALSLDWSSNKMHTIEPFLVISDSSGKIHLVKVFEDGLQKIGVWYAHGFEAWIAAFDYWNDGVFYSGGDDCLFKSYDMRVPETAVAISKCHEAGVTSIRSHVDVEHQLLTGSYDEKVRLWDTRHLKKPLTVKKVGGGAWRLKWHPQRPNVVLAALMYGGFRVLRVDENISDVCQYLDHESIAYGADWQFKGIDTTLVATCSFYDCKLHLSEIHFK